MIFKTIICSILLAASSAFAVNFDSDVPPAIAKQMSEDLVFMYTLQGANQTPFHKEIFGTLSGAAYQKFFESHIKAVGLDDCGGGAAVACVIPFFDQNKMWLTQNFIKFSHPQIARLMVFSTKLVMLKAIMETGDMTHAQLRSWMKTVKRKSVFGLELSWQVSQLVIPLSTVHTDLRLFF